jgi:SM-20-related protein
LLERAKSIDDYQRAGIGRGDDHQQNSQQRKDCIHWLEPASPADQLWLELMEHLRLAVNRHFFMGLFEFESHYAYYPPGGFYRKHLDAFKGEGNRLLSVVLYLNDEWLPDDGGELVLYDGQDVSLGRFLPQGGTVAVFLSEEFPHEVLPARRERYSIAGWFRLNNSTSERVDPPA